MQFILMAKHYPPMALGMTSDGSGSTYPAKLLSPAFQWVLLDDLQLAVYTSDNRYFETILTKSGSGMDMVTCAQLGYATPNLRLAFYSPQELREEHERLQSVLREKEVVTANEIGAVSEALGCAS